MATVRSPSSVPARKMRIAISLRLAASNFLNGRTARLGAPDLLRLNVVMPIFFIVGRRANGNQRGQLQFGAERAAGGPFAIIPLRSSASAASQNTGQLSMLSV